MSHIETSRGNAARQLRAYGEDAAAEAAARFSEGELERVEVRAFEYACTSDGRKDGRGMMFDKAIALAALEVVEGAPRPLRRRRRRFAPGDRPPGAAVEAPAGGAAAPAWDPADLPAAWRPPFDGPALHAVLMDHGFRRADWRPSGGVYRRMLSPEHGYWVTATAIAGQVNASFGFIWPELNRYALRVLLAATPADYPGRRALAANRPTIGPALYMLNGHEVRSVFGDVGAFEAALAVLLSGAQRADTLAEAIERASAPRRGLQSHRILIPAALALLGRAEECRARCEGYLATAVPTAVREFYEPYYAALLRPGPGGPAPHPEPEGPGTRGAA